MLSEHGRVGVSVVKRVHAGVCFAVECDVHGLHMSSRYNYLEIVEKANVTGSTNVLPNHHGGVRLTFWSGPLANSGHWPNHRGGVRLTVWSRPLAIAGGHNEYSIMSNVSYKPSFSQGTGGAWGARAVRHRGSPKPLVVDAD